MAEGLVPCTACSRHIRCGEVACPFCGAVVLSTSQAPAASSEVFGRLAAAAAVAAGVAQVASCTVPGAGGAGTGVLEDGGFPEDATVGFEDAAAAVFYGSPGIVPVTLACRSSADCQPGDVCCGNVMIAASCQKGPCPDTPVGPLQLCGITAECRTVGDVCGPPSPSIQMLALGTVAGSIMTCNAPDGGVEGGNATDAGVSDEASLDGGAAGAEGGDGGAPDTGGEPPDSPAG